MELRQGDERTGAQEPRAPSPGPPAPEELAVLSTIDPDDVFAALSTRVTGLAQDEARTRLERDGRNEIEELPGPSPLRKFLAQFVHLFALLLWAGAVLALLTGQAAIAIAIVAVIVLNGLFGYLQENRAERAVAALKKLLPTYSTVVRGGEESRIPVEELVRGDVLRLDEGDRVSADARLVEAVDVRADESSLTGEAVPVHKSADAEQQPPRTPMQAHNMVFAGSSVTSGSATAVVVRTGMRTEFGRTAALTQSVRPEPSPLQVEVGRVAQRVAVLSVGMGVGFFVLAYMVAGLTLRGGAVFAIGIVLGNVPEGLLPTMTLALAMGVQRMAARNAIVKRLSSVETLGSCTVICTDKTGTITKNQMTVKEVWAGGKLATVGGAGYAPEGPLLLEGAPVTGEALEGFRTALRIGHLCNSARLLPPDGDDGWRVIGDPTEGALLVAAAKAGLDREEDERLHPVVRKMAFEAKRKRMSTIHHAHPGGDGLVAFVKGAPREMLDHCSRELVDGKDVELTDERRDEIVGENDRMARSGLRVLAMAYRELPPKADRFVGEAHPGDIEQQMVFAGLVAMQDPPRDEVPAAVEKCHVAGIRIVMVTGDYGLTAESIARQVGIVHEGPVAVVEGADVEGMSEDDLRGVLTEGQVIFSRATPEHKLRVVTALRDLGEVVAVTGDGVNDAPALKRADIGVAMGMAGTDVAREAAEMILVDDNFATIVGAVEEGRAIFDNMRKFIVYIFAHLSPEAIPFIFYALFRIPLPLTVMQILAIDLGTETLPALALGVERPEPDVMARPPRRRSERLLSAGSLTRGYAFLGGMTTAVVLSAFFLFLYSHGWSWGQSAAPTKEVGLEASTIVFLGIVLMQVGNAFACRTERASAFTIGLFGNRMLLWGIAFELVFAAALIYVPFLQTVFRTGPVGAEWWAYLLAFVPVIFLAEESRKAIQRRRHRRREAEPA
jgi:magnesium-transporting ATPase (P-type)